MLIRVGVGVLKFHVSLRSALLTGTALVGAASLVLLLPDQAAMATTCTNGAAATIDTTNCTVATGTVPTTVTFANSPTGTLILNGASPTGAINATTAGQGNITVQANTTLAAGATIGATTAINDITINGSRTLDASAVSTINAHNLIVGGSNSTLILGNTTLTVTGRLDANGSGDKMVVTGAATVNGLVGTVNGIDTVINDGASLTTNSSTYRSTTVLGSGSGAQGTLTLSGTTSLQGPINGNTAGRGNLVIDGNVTTVSGIGIGNGKALNQITINSGNTLDVRNSSTVAATNITVGAGGGNGTLTLGNTTVTVTGQLDGAGGAGNIVIVDGTANIKGNIGQSNGIDMRVNDGKSLTTTGNVRSTIQLGSGSGANASLTLQGTSNLEGVIRGSAAGHGTLVINGSITSTANIGDTNSLAQIIVNGSRSLNATSVATIAATNITLNSGSTLTIGNTTVTGALDGGTSASTLRVAGTATVNGAIGQTNRVDITVNDGNSLTTTGNVNSFVTLGSGSGAQGTLTLQGTSTLKGSISANAMDRGNLVIDGDITSQATMNSVRLNSVTVNANRSLTMGESKGIWANGVTLGNGATLSMLGGTLNSAVDGAAAGDGTLVFNGNAIQQAAIGGTNGLNSVSVADNRWLTAKFGITATTVSLGDGSSLNGGGGSVTGALSLKNSTLGLYDNSLTVSNGVTVENGKAATLQTKLGASAATILNITGGALTLGNAASSLTVSPWLSGRAAKDDDIYVIVSSTNATVQNGGTISGPSSSGLVLWTTRVATAGDAGTDVYGRTVNVGQDIVMVSQTRKAAEVPGVTKEVSDVIDKLPTNPSSPKDTELVAALQNLGSASELNNAGAQLKPETGRGSVEAAVGATTQALAVVGNRAETIRTASSGKTGISTGEMIEGTGFWAEGFGHMADQGHRGTSDGYSSSTAGLAFGVDTRVSEPLRVGLAGTHSQTWMDEKGARSRNGDDIKSYGAILYSSYAGEPWYFDTSLAVALHRYTSQRGIGFSGFDGIARNKHDGMQYTGKAEAGYPLQLGGNTTLTPLANVTWTRLVQESYEEYGAGGANLSIGRASSDSLLSGLGGKLSREFASSYGTLVPELRLTWLHEFKGAAPATAAAFTSGGAAFTSEGTAPARNGALIGAGLTLLANENYELSANLDVELRDAYVGQSGRIRLRSAF